VSSAGRTVEDQLLLVLQELEYAAQPLRGEEQLVGHLLDRAVFGDQLLLVLLLLQEPPEKGHRTPRVVSVIGPEEIAEHVVRLLRELRA
jgi:hypothetical protein